MTAAQWAALDPHAREQAHARLRRAAAARSRARRGGRPMPPPGPPIGREPAPVDPDVHDVDDEHQAAA